MRYLLLISIILILGCKESEKKEPQEPNVETQKKLVSQETLKKTSLDDYKYDNEIRTEYRYDYYYEGKLWKNSFHNSSFFSEYSPIDILIREDVYRYYPREGTSLLLDEYDTPLKRKVFSETDEYKNKLRELQEIKAEFLRGRYYLDWRFQESNSGSLTYNLKNKTFSLKNYTKSSESLNSDQFVFTSFILNMPYGVTTDTETISFYSEDYDPLDDKRRIYNQRIRFSVPNEQVALKIENNSDDVRILFSFRFADRETSDSDLYYTNDVHVLIYNHISREIYMLYK